MGTDTLHLTSLSLGFLALRGMRGYYPLCLGVGDTKLLAYLPKAHPLAIQLLCGTPLLTRLREVLVARFRAPCSPLLPLSLSVPPPLGVLRDYRLQVPLFVGRNTKILYYPLVGKPVTGIPLLTAPLDRLSCACILCARDDSVHPRSGLGLAPACIVLPKLDKLPLQGVRLY